MLTLLIKDFKLMFSGGKGSSKGWIRALVSVLFVGFFIGIEVFLFSAILDRIKAYSDARIIFIRLFLFLLSVLMTFSAIFRARKLFFNEQDIRQLANHPVENSKLIFSKMVFLVLVQCATALIFEYPIFIAYGVAIHKPVLFYYQTFFYPLLAAILELGIALLLVYPVHMLLEFLKKHVVLEFLLTVALIFAVAIPYGRVLNVFVELVTENALTMLFTEESLLQMRGFTENVVPLNLLADAFLTNHMLSIFIYLALAGGVLVMGLTLTVYAFHHVRNMTVHAHVRVRKRPLCVRTPRQALIRKELALLTKNSDYVFSFSGLLVAQPFIAYLIVTAMNAIFSSGTFLYYTGFFPGFVPLMDVFLILMITLIINSGANRYVTMEERTVKNMKTIPVPYRTQLLIKMLLPYSMSAALLLVTVLLLWILGVISVATAIFALLLSLAALLVFDLASLREELHVRHGRPRTTFLSSLISYVLPLSYVVLGAVLAFFGFPVWATGLLGLLLFGILGLPLFLQLRRRMGDWFMELEAIN